MISNRGVTLTSLTVYIIVSVIVLGSLTFLNVNFMTQIADLTTKSEKTNEILKIEAFLIEDVKSANNVIEFSNDMVKFDNGVIYNIRYRADEKSSGDQSYNKYELYRNNVMITDNMANISFDYDYKRTSAGESDIKTEWIIAQLYYEQKGNLYGTKMYIKIGNGK